MSISLLPYPQTLRRLARAHNGSGTRWLQPRLRWCSRQRRRPGRPIAVLTLNIAYGSHAPLTRIAEVVRTAGAEVVALQEVDRFTRRQPLDQATVLGELLGMEVAYAPAIAYQGGEFGVALLSRLPILDMTLHLLRLLDRHTVPAPARIRFGCRRDDIEQRVLLVARLDRGGGGADIAIGTTHLGLCGDRERVPRRPGNWMC